LPQFGQITADLNTPRQFQFASRFTFWAFLTSTPTTRSRWSS